MPEYAGHRPYGDIYTVPTTAVDNIANRLYREQQLREQQRAQESKMLDDEFGKNIAKVKSVDIPEITSAYNDYKQAYISLMRKGNKATPQDHMDVMIKKANANEKINGSVEDKEYLKGRVLEGRADKKGRYNINFNKIINDQLNTPTSKRNRDKDDELLLNQYSFPDLPKFTAEMVGVKPTEIKVKTGKPSVKGDLYDDENVYQRFNHPNKMYENAFLSASTRPDRVAFENVVLNSLNDQEKQDLATRYFAKISSPEFKAIYGDVQPFPESASKTELGQAVALSVMSAVDKLPIQPLRTESKENQQAVMDKRRKEGMADFKIKQRILQADRKELFGMREAAKEAGQEANELWLDRYLGQIRDEAKKSGKIRTYKFADGKAIEGYQVPLDPVLSKAVGFDDKNKGILMVTEDDKYIPVFYETDANYNPIEKNGQYAVDKTKTNILSQDAIKLALGGKTGVKQLNKEMKKKSPQSKSNDPLGIHN